MKVKFGRVVWHDLMTNNIEKAMSFYSELLGWEYRIEHAREFAWRPGEGEYPLIMVKGQAHGGFVDPGREIQSKWVAYVTVRDVDSASANARALGATIEREPFDVPGVGRSALISDPQGAVICPFKPAHNSAPPSGTFLWDELLTDQAEPAKEFYGQIFGWQAKDIETPGMGIYTVFKYTEDQESVAGSFNHAFGRGKPASWLTYIAAEDVDASVAKAKTLGAELIFGVKEVSDEGRFAILKDPTGAKFGLFTPITT